MNITIICKNSSGEGYAELSVSLGAKNNMEVNLVEDSGVFISDQIIDREIGEAKELTFMKNLLGEGIGIENVESSGGSVIDCFITNDAAIYLKDNATSFESAPHIVN